MSTEKDNRLVWDQQKSGHYEVWYATFNHRRSGTGYWIRYTLESPHSDHHAVPYCQIWFAFFDSAHPEKNWGINRRLPISEFVANDNPFTIHMGNATLKHGRISGSLSSDKHSTSWDLAFKPSLFTHRHLPDLVYDTSFADTTVLSPNPMVHFTGTVEVNGETYEFDGEPGCQSHLWGRKHAHAHAWSHCSAFREDPTACLKSLSVRLRRFGVVTPTMTFLSLYLGSEVYHFRDFRSLLRTRSNWETGLYRFSGVGNRVKVEGEMRCRPEDLLMATYSDPDGEQSFCHNTEVADASLTVWTRRSVGTPFRKLCRLTCRRGAHFEYTARTPDGRVTHKHLLVH